MSFDLEVDHEDRKAPSPEVTLRTQTDSSYPLASLASLALQLEVVSEAVSSNSKY